MEPTLKIEPTDDEDIWIFLDYGEEFKDSYNHRWLIQYRPQRNAYYLISTFPYTHENGLINLKKEIELAQEAIDILKKREI